MTTNQIEDRLAIEDTLVALCYALDQADWDAMRALLAPDVTWSSDSFGAHHGVEGWIENQTSSRSRLVRAQHLISNLRFDISGDTARVDSYVQGYDVFIGREDQVVRIVGTYHDELARIGGRWLVTARRFERLWLDPL